MLKQLLNTFAPFILVLVIAFLSATSAQVYCTNNHPELQQQVDQVVQMEVQTQQKIQALSIELEQLNNN